MIVMPYLEWTSDSIQGLCYGKLGLSAFPRQACCRAHSLTKLSMDRSKFWEEMLDVYRFGLGDVASHTGTHSCFCLRLTGHVVRTGDSMLLKAYIDDEAQLICSRMQHPDLVVPPTSSIGGKIMLRTSFQDYDVVLRHVQEVRVIQAYVQHKDGVTILDATASPCFFSGFAPTQTRTTLQVAELFSGGFAGWSRAIATLRECGLPLHVSWILERDPACWPCLHAMDANLCQAHSVHDFVASSHPADTVLVADDFRTHWWRKLLHLRPADILVVSPPCQPWSSAGRFGGLNVPDGILLLEVVEMLKVSNFEVAIFEEVDGFSRHQHFPVFYQAMRAAGFECQWRAPLQLAELAPASRTRFFLIFTREHRASTITFTARHWRALGFPSLAKAEAFFPSMPAALLAPCQLEPDVLEMYLSTDPLPKGPNGRRQTSLQASRIRTPDQQALCFMAAYHYQHELPLDRVWPSLLCLSRNCRLSSVNVAFLIPRVDKDAMRILGNSLSTFQAAFVLGLSLQNFPELPIKADAKQCVEWCQSACMRFPTTLLFEVQAGWMMCSVSRLGQLLARQAIHDEMLLRLLPTDHVFRTLYVATGEGDSAVRFQLKVSQHISDDAALQDLSLVPDMVVPACQDLPARYDCAQPFSVFSLATAACQSGKQQHVIAWADASCYVACRHRPDFLHQLRQIFQAVRQGSNGRVACFDAAGIRYHDVATLPNMIWVCSNVDDIPLSCPVMPREAVAAAAPLPEAPCFTIQIACDYAFDWYMAFPQHLLNCVGWHSSFSDFPMQSDQVLCIGAMPGPAAVFDADSIRLWLRNLTFLAPLRVVDESLSSPACAQTVLVEVQIGRVTWWTGNLPASLTFEVLEQSWIAASEAVGTSSAACIFSGPFPVPLAFKLGDSLTCSAQPLSRRKTGALLLTVWESFQGGGAKDDKIQNIKSQIAKICLDQGFALADVTAVTTTLVQHAPQGRLQQLLSVRPLQERWDQLRALMQQHGIPEPARRDITARVAQRVQAQVRKKNLFHESLRAADFTLAGGFFLNDDKSEATILRKLAPNASGAVLLDKDVASEVLAGSTQSCTDELGVACLGNCCPHPATCSQAIHFPAFAHGTEGQGHVLLAGCLHNIGGRPIRVSVRNIEQVTLADTVPCTFQAFKDEWMGPPVWDEVVKSPVKTLLADFRQTGMDLSTMQPWARTFKAQGRVTVPAMSDMIHFNACVPLLTLPQLLRSSGHEGVYVTPRNEQGHIREGWSVISVSSSKAEAARLALGATQQAGLVRSKDRYGIRVSSDDYDQVFRKLKPEQEPRAPLAVQKLFKLCPTPAGTPESIRQWTTALNWPVKVLKGLGPNQWLIGSSQDPPEGWLAIRGQTVLTIPVQQRAKDKQVVKAGHQHLASVAAQRKEVTEGHDTQASDPLQRHDPWLAYYNRSKAAAIASAPADAPAKTALPRSVPEAGPISQKFQAQLEAAVKSLQDGQAAQEEQRKADQAAVASNFSTLSQQFSASIEALQRAQQSQQEQLVQSMNDLKSLIVTQHASSEPSKKHKAANTAQVAVSSKMEWEPGTDH